MSEVFSKIMYSLAFVVAFLVIAMVFNLDDQFTRAILSLLLHAGLVFAAWIIWITQFKKDASLDLETAELGGCIGAGLFLWTFWIFLDFPFQESMNAFADAVAFFFSNLLVLAPTSEEFVRALQSKGVACSTSVLNLWIWTARPLIVLAIYLAFREGAKKDAIKRAEAKAVRASKKRG